MDTPATPVSPASPASAASQVGEAAPRSAGAAATAPPARTLLVLGASGDLAKRLLLPGLADLLERSGEHEGLVEPGLQLVGAGVEDLDDAAWADLVATSFSAAGKDTTGDEVVEPDRSGAGDSVVDRVRSTSRYRRTDVTDAKDLQALVGSCEGPVAVYFALPPAITRRACEAMAQTGVPAGTQLVMEKPFGTGTASAVSLNDLVATIVPESQVHRVDHFLGRSTTLNVLGVRLANRLFEPLLNAEHVERIDVVYDEDLALEGRARYYDGAGALVDMIQSHLLQVVALVMMEAPATLGARDLRDAKATLLRATSLAGDPPSASRRARYTAGTSRGREVPDYAAEDGVDPDLGTETFAEITLAVDTWRWAGVPVRVRSGKALGAPRKEVVVTFRPVPHLVEGLHGPVGPSRLRLGFAPDSVTLEMAVNSPGDPFVLDAVSLSAQMGASALPAYGQVLAGVLAGDPTLSVRGDTAEDCWRIVTPVLDAWRAGDVPLVGYAAGGGGPEPTAGFPEV